MATGQTQWEPPPGYAGITLTKKNSLLKKKKKKRPLEPQIQYQPNQGSQSTLYGQSESNFYEGANDRNAYPSQSSIYQSQQNFNSSSSTTSLSAANKPGNKGKAAPPARGNNANNNSSSSSSSTNFNSNSNSSNNNNNNKNNNNNPGKSGINLASSSSSTGSKWRKAKDPNTGKDYYYHIDTKETRWTAPPEMLG
ncbi:RGS domain-containing protein, partial [Reticulomyxa filosa]